MISVVAGDNGSKPQLQPAAVLHDDGVQRVRQQPVGRRQPGLPVLRSVWSGAPHTTRSGCETHRQRIVNGLQESVWQLPRHRTPCTPYWTEFDWCLPCFVDCELNTHRQCMDKLREPCLGSKSKKNKRHSVLEKIIRKPSSNNPAASTCSKPAHIQ